MNKQKKEKKRKRFAAITQQIKLKETAEYKSAKASKYLYHLGEYHKQCPDIVAILYCRVSTGAQKHKENLYAQEWALRRKLKKLNIPIVSCYYEVSSGWVLDSKKRWAFKNAVALAKRYIKNGKTAVIVATSSDRFLRNREFNTNTNPDVLPIVAEFEEFGKLIQNMPCATLLHPDMPPNKVRGYQSKWGQRTKKNKGGRPRKKMPGYKKKLRQEKLDTVIQLHNKGKTISVISFRTGVKPNTVKDWIDRYCYLYSTQN
ncbi:MAG: hypothetical protein BWY26_01007 [Elusimicrobia bacterium ADurb.Bin231]|nr:MAG: hypothetical protein BWY26_01007 [Elusimicrobia bacterium ADurb.Bin231]